MRKITSKSFFLKFQVENDFIFPGKRLNIMKQFLSLLFLGMVLAGTVFNQSKSNDVILQQIKEANAEKTITLQYDAAGNSSKVMLFSEDFGKSQYESLGLKSLSFGMAFFYAGKNLMAPPTTVNLTFWVQTKKPKFADEHNAAIVSGAEIFNLGEARYVSRPNENMEYLNLVVPYETLMKMTDANAVLNLGTAQFKFTPAQRKSVATLVKISDPAML